MTNKPINKTHTVKSVGAPVKPDEYYDNISYNSTTGKIFKDDPNVRIPQKDLVNQLQKDKMADDWSSPLHRGPSYDHSARTLQQEQDLGKKMWLEKQKIDDQPLPVGLGNKYKSDIRTPNQKKKDAWDEKKYNIRQRLKNVRGPAVWDLVKQVSKTPEEIAEVRKVINDHVKAVGHTKYVSRDEVKFLDKKEEDKPIYQDSGIADLEALHTPPEQPRETLKQYTNRKEQEYKVKEFNNAIKTGVGTLFRMLPQK